MLAADRNVPPHTVLARDPTLGDLQGTDFDDVAVVQTHETYRRTQDEIVIGLEIADESAPVRIQQRWVLADDPEDSEPVIVPTVVMTGRQDASTGYLDMVAPGALPESEFHGPRPRRAQPADRATRPLRSDDRGMAGSRRRIPQRPT